MLRLIAYGETGIRGPVYLCSIQKRGLVKEVPGPGTLKFTDNSGAGSREGVACIDGPDLYTSVVLVSKFQWSLIIHFKVLLLQIAARALDETAKWYPPIQCRPWVSLARNVK
jgi:hypothetical protein